MEMYFIIIVFFLDVFEGIQRLVVRFEVLLMVGKGIWEGEVLYKCFF